jgi:hypothetical protein
MMSLERIRQNQNNILRKCKNFLINEKKKNIDISESPLCFFTTWANTPGYFKVLELHGLKKKNQIIFIFKNLLSISKNFDLKLFFNDNKISSMAQNIIVSYSTKKNFDSQGNFSDDYFDFNSRNKNFFWFLISLDNYIPLKIQKNTAIIAKKNKTSFSLLYFYKHLLQIFIKSKFNFRLIKHNCWYESNYSEKVSDIIINLINIFNVKNLIINYEGTPFQNYLTNKIKMTNNKIRTLGYLHCAPWPLQLDLIYKNQLLDKLIVSGNEQKKILTKYYCWSKKKISCVPSLRFKKKKLNQFSGYLFVPYNLDNNQDYLERLELYLKENKNTSVNFKVRIHPLNCKSKKHLDFKKRCELLFLKYSTKKKSKPQNHSLFFGSATGVCVQALEEGTIITHFPNNEDFDVFSSSIWSNIEVKKIGKKTYMYNLKKKNYTFLTNNKKNKFLKYLKPFLKK